MGGLRRSSFVGRGRFPPGAGLRSPPGEATSQPRTADHPSAQFFPAIPWNLNVSDDDG
jgi:hypothetical protein